MKIFFSFVIACLLSVQVFGFQLPFSNHLSRSSSKSFAAKNDEFSALQQRLQARVNQNKVQVELKLESKAPVKTTVAKKEATQSVAVTKQQTAEKRAAEAPKKQATAVEKKTASVVAPPPVKQVEVKKEVSTAQVVAPSNGFEINGVELVGGLGLGTLPFLLVPVLLYNSLNGLIKKPKPLPPKPTPPPSKVKTYTKSLSEGAKEGYAELASGKKTPELEDTRRAYKIVTASFGLAAATAAFSFFSSGAQKEVAVAPKLENKVVQVAPKKVEAAKVVEKKVSAPAPAPKVEVKAPEVKVPPTPSPPTATQSVAEQKSPVAEKKVDTVVVEKPAVAVKTEETKPTPVEKPAVPAVVTEVAKPVEKKEETKALVQETKKVEESVQPSAVVSVQGSSTDAKNVVQQVQPDVIDLAKFQSLRNKK